MSKIEQNTKQILENQMKDFRIRMTELWREKKKLFSLFRSKLEEKKIQEVKNTLSSENK